MLLMLFYEYIIKAVYSVHIHRINKEMQFDVKYCLYVQHIIIMT